MKIISAKEKAEYKDKIISYIQQSWPEVLLEIYTNCINHCIKSPNPLPQWYVLLKNNQIIGCAGLVTNDFISRMDLYPWLAALFISERQRGNAYGSLLIEKAKQYTQKAVFKNLYLCTDLIDFYEQYGFTYIGKGYHPWGEESRIYEIESLSKN